jgi:hypothetical protein
MSQESDYVTIASMRVSYALTFALRWVRGLNTQRQESEAQGWTEVSVVSGDEPPPLLYTSPNPRDVGGQILCPLKLARLNRIVHLLLYILP